MTARSVPEWIGPKPETSIPPRVKDRVLERQEGRCACGCGVKLGMTGEAIEFDHTIALINGGENRESNIRALRRPCHKVKTREDVAQKSVEKRKRNKHFGIKAESRAKIPGSKGTRWKKKISGEIVSR